MGGPPQAGPTPSQCRRARPGPVCKGAVLHGAPRRQAGLLQRSLPQALRDPRLADTRFSDRVAPDQNAAEAGGGPAPAAHMPTAPVANRLLCSGMVHAVGGRPRWGKKEARVLVYSVAAP